MKKIMICIISISTAINVVAQTAENNSPNTTPVALEPIVDTSLAGIIFPILFISFLVFILLSIVKYLLEYRLANRIIDKGMPEQLSAFFYSKKDENKLDGSMKIAILFCGLGAGLFFTHVTAPVGIHSLAIMAFSIGLSYLAYSYFLQKQKK
jgi:hypothetical protein